MVDDRPVQRAVLLGLASAAVGLALMPGALLRRPSRHWYAPPRRALLGVAVALWAAGLYDGWGLSALEALAAVLVAGGLGALTLLVTRSARPPHRLLIVGSGRVADALCSEIARAGRAKVVGQVDEQTVSHVLAGDGDLERLVRKHGVDGVLFASASVRDPKLAELAARCRALGLALGVAPLLHQQFAGRVRGGYIGGLPLLLVDERPEGRLAALGARAVDCLIATVALLLTAPLWIAIAVAIVVDEPGPVLYRARRVGYRGRGFDMYKFRKMRRDAAGPALTVAADERFTRVGRFLARSKLDELPQLLNVLSGEMALVGPRPEDASFVAAYPAEFEAITSVRPGITGLSQIHFRNESSLLVGDDFETLYRELLLPHKITLDLFYARHRSLGLDLRILAWTLIAIVSGATVRRDELTASVSFARLDRSAVHEPIRLSAPPQPDVLRDVV